MSDFPSGQTSLDPQDQIARLEALEAQPPEVDKAHASPDPVRQVEGEVMYIEEKSGLAGCARIGRIRFSQTRRTLYYKSLKLQSLKGGYKANYFDLDTKMEYWVSGCKKDGNDTLYPGTVEIDEDAREEYWLKIRSLPDQVHLKSFRSEGKYSKRRPS